MDINFLSLNVCGLKNKCITPEFTGYLQKYDIIGFQETKLSEIDSLELETFKIFTKTRESRSRVSSGGIAIAVSESISNYIIPIKTKSSLVYWFKISSKFTKLETDILCGVIYIPPENTRYSCPEPFLEIQNELESLNESTKYVLLFGDLNSRTGKLDDYVQPDQFILSELNIDVLENEYGNELTNFQTGNVSFVRKTMDKVTNNYGYKLINFCKNNSLYILNGRLGRDKNQGKVTCRNVSCVDYFISNVNLLPCIVDMFVDNFCPLLSDVHNPVTLKCSFKVRALECDTLNKKPSERIKLWDRHLPELFVDNIDIVKVSEVEEQLNLLTENNSVHNSDINSIATKLGNIFVNSAELSYGKIISNNYHVQNNKVNNKKSWFGRNCATARREFHRAKHQYNATKSAENKLNLKDKGAKYKKILHINRRRYIQSKANTLQDLKNSDPKMFWKTITNRKRSKTNISTESFYNYMKNINKDNGQYNNDSVSYDNQELPEFDFINDPITVDEIRSNVQKLSNGKSNGLDQILNEHIKSTLHILMPVYYKFFNLVFDSGIIPESWTLGSIIPIYKNKGAQSDPENYRPITLVSCLGKLFTSIINSRLQSFAREFELLSESQTGFRKTYSTCDSIFALHMLISILFNQKKKLFCAFIDFQRAFDTVWRDGLWVKILAHKIRGKCFNIIYNLYQNIKSCVFVNGETSAFFDCTIGVRQGDNLSPFLFSLYLNDLEDFLRSQNVNGITCDTKPTNDIDRAVMFFKLFVFLYADDTALVAESAKDLQYALNTFKIYCTTWKLTVNISKTKVIVFGKGRMPKNIAFSYDEIPLRSC